MNKRVALVLFVVAALGGRLAKAQVEGPRITEVPQYLVLLKQPHVQREINLVDYQFSELAKIHLRLRAIMADSHGKLERMLPEERPKALSSLKENLAGVEFEAFDVLTPIQQKRLEQIRIQTMIRAAQPTAGLTHHKMADWLGLTETQLQRVREKGEEVDAKLQEKLEKLRAEMRAEHDKARRQVLAVLTEAQRAEYYKLVGEPFETGEQPSGPIHGAAFARPKEQP